MNKLTVQVTRADIEVGITGRSSKCPIALAFNRAFAINDAQVDNYSFESRTMNAYFCLPTACDRFIMAFDAKKSVKPFSFTLSARCLQRLSSSD